MTCEKCNKPAEYGPEEAKPLTVSYRAAGRPVVTEAFQPSGARCDDCLGLELAERCDRLADRERLRASYRREVERRQAANEPIVCAECRRQLGEFLAVEEKRVLCQTCVYTELRDVLLRKAIASTTNSKDRCQAGLVAMRSAREQSKRAFAYIWG